MVPVSLLVLLYETFHLLEKKVFLFESDGKPKYLSLNCPIYKKHWDLLSTAETASAPIC